MKPRTLLKRREMLVAAMLVAAVHLSFAHGVSKGDLVLDHPYATPSLSGVKNGSVYLRGIQNKGEKLDRLLSASSPAAARVELHRMTLDKGVMRMREVPSIDLPPQSTTSLRHGGDYHLMLVELKQPLKDGDRFELTLNFERTGTQTVKVWVQTPRATSNTEHQH
jgi:copper(I)-binding protein